MKSLSTALILNFLFLVSAYCEDITFGMSTALSGPAQELGKNMFLGVTTAFDRVNANGGINGKMLKLIVEDDGYEPDRTGPAMRKLIEKDQVLGIVGNVGTPTAIVSIPIANEFKTLFFAAFTGAGVLRKSPPDKYVINYRASYAEETGAMVDGLISEVGLKPDEIAFFTQRDGYGDAGFNGGIEALKRHGLQDELGILHARYERNTLAVENALSEFISRPVAPKAIIMVGAYAPCAKFIKIAKESGIDSLFLNVSFVGSEPLANELGKSGNGVIVTQVVPPQDSKEPIVNEFEADLKKFKSGSTFSLGAFEGYIASRILAKALESHKGTPTRDSVVNALEGLGDFNIGTGADLSLSADKHQASHKVWLTKIDNGKIVSTNWSDFKGTKKKV